MTTGTYNALDNIKLARDLREKLVLEIADMQSNLDYSRATDATHNDDDEIAFEYGKEKIRNLQTAITKYLTWSDGDFTDEHS